MCYPCSVNAVVKIMRKNDSEVISMTSSTSKGSGRHKQRFSIQRLFYTGRSSQAKTKSRISLNSNSSTHSDSFLTAEREIDSGIVGATSSQSNESNAVGLPVAFLPMRCILSPLKSDCEEVQRECPLCLMEHPAENFPDISTCYHRSCLNCLQTYLRIEITESRINIACPECAEKFHPNDIRDIIQDNVLMSKYEDFMVRRVLVSDPDARWCPAPDCGYAVIATECAGCPKIKCEKPSCNTNFCYHCKQYWHPNKTCDAARAERALMDARNGSITYSHDADSQKDFIKPCPRCSAFIMKMNDGSCNHMTCPVCGAEFCWLCMKEISDLHYLSPSGCTFWGKKPWSRKKKILWQLGTLVGAPVGITLLAGIAVPAMLIGIPVWVGKKIHSHLETSSRHRHNLAMVGGITASILVSPIIAGLAVGIGVPILLGYVYGVVPISLCRSGGCGVRTTNSGGVRFEFEENETGVPSALYLGAIDSQSVGTGHQVPNPSISPSIGEASVGMTNSIYSGSGNHIDRVDLARGDESDRDSTSHRAIAGASLNGSMCDSTYAAVISMHTKLEVQAELETDPPTGKRSSFSSDSANFSIGEKSIGDKSAVGDDASTQALAGSIVNYKLDAVSLTTPDVQADISKFDYHNKTVEHDGNCSDTNAQLTLPHIDITSNPTYFGHLDGRKKTRSCPGSPHSNCGSIYEHDDSVQHLGSRCRKCRKTGKHTEKHAIGSEQMNVHFSDQVSLQSFQAEDTVLDLPMGKHDIDSLSEMCNEEFESDDWSRKCNQRFETTQIICEPAIVLVENCRKEAIGLEQDKQCSNCDNLQSGCLKQVSTVSLEDHSIGSCNNIEGLNSCTSSISIKYSKYGNDSEEMTLSKCRSEEIFTKRKTRNTDGIDSVAEKSKSEELCNKDDGVGILGGKIKRVRRDNCELAIRNGQMSPLSVIHDSD